MALAWVSLCQSVLAQAQSTFHTIDLMEFTRKPLSVYRTNETWSTPPPGLHTWASVPFQMGGKLDTTGMGSVRDSRFYPTRLIGIPVGKKGHVLHVLHAAAYDDADGTPVARMVLNYANGQRRSFLFVYGVHTRKWDLDRKTLEDTNTVVAWTGRNVGTDLRLVKTAFANPLPAVEIKSIELISLFSRANLMIVAMTLEEAARGDARLATGVLAATSEDDSAYRAELILRVLDTASETGLTGAELKLEVIDEENRLLGFGTYKADSKGQIVLAYPPKEFSAFRFELTAPDHVGTRTDLEKPAGGLFPAQHTIKLERGIEIGGVVRTASGQPIADAAVTIYGVIRDAAGQFLLARHGSAQTDGHGKWTSRAVPKEFNQLQLYLRHPEYRPKEYESASDPADGSVLSQDLLAGKAVMLMQGGINIEGKVLDPAGKGIPNAEVVLSRHLDETPTNRTARTDSAGSFKFVLMEEADLHLVVQATGYAPSFRHLTPAHELEPVEFRLSKGKIVKGRVLDKEDKPISGATVRVNSWVDGPPLDWESQSDVEGRFVWESAPEGAVNLSVQAKGYMAISGRQIRLSDEEIVRLEKTCMVSGKVLDAETKEPIQEFSIIQGRNYVGGDVYWERHNATNLSGTGGSYSIENSQPTGGGRLQLLVEALGYLPSVSPPFAGLRWYTNDFLLKKGEGPKGKVRLPDGDPVRGAEVALIGAGTHVSLGKARFKNANNSDDTITGADGRFSFPSRYATAVIAIHDQGYAEATPEELAASGELVLRPWGTLKGTLILGGKPGTNESVMLAANRFGRGLNYDWSNFKKDTGDEGRFEFSHVPPGERFLVRLIPSDDRSWMWSNITPVDIKPGEVTTLTYGGTGRTVIGKVKPSDSKRQINWRSGHHSFTTPWPKPPKQFQTAEEADTWNDSPEMKEARKNYRYYAVRFSDDGSFRIDGVAPGTYNLTLHFREEEGRRFIGSISREVEVPVGSVEEPLDLSVLELVTNK